MTIQECAQLVGGPNDGEIEQYRRYAETLELTEAAYVEPVIDTEAVSVEVPRLTTHTYKLRKIIYVYEFEGSKTR